MSTVLSSNFKQGYKVHWQLIFIFISCGEKNRMIEKEERDRERERARGYQHLAHHESSVFTTSPFRFHQQADLCDGSVQDVSLCLYPNSANKTLLVWNSLDDLSHNPRIPRRTVIHKQYHISFREVSGSCGPPLTLLELRQERQRYSLIHLFQTGWTHIVPASTYAARRGHPC